MKIYYIPLGSFCYPKMIIRETNRELSQSLPFDFNSSPHLTGITDILYELYNNRTYDIELKEIIEQYNGNELAVSEKNMYLVHFFKEYDLIKKIENLPVNAYEYLNSNKINEIKYKFKKRFDRLLNVLNDTNSVLCFLRIENYDNAGWKYELEDFTKVLSLFKNPNKFLIYSQKLIDDELHFDNSQVLNYQYHIPIFFYKHYFYDMEMINNKDLFINILDRFEDILNNNKIIHIKHNDLIEKYYIDIDKSMMFKLTNLNNSSKFFIDSDNNLFINSALDGNTLYIKDENGIYSKSM
jgi:hypothetical protein